MPGEGLSVLETVMYFVLAPTGLFIGISLIVYLAVRPKNAHGTAGRAITKIN
jgi:hypothetical protein